MDKRLAEIEIKLSFSEDLLEELNRVVYRQQKQIDQLQEAVRALRLQLAASMPGEADNAAQEKPPHY